MRQNLAETVAFEAVAAEFSVPIQAAGLRLGIIDICKSDCPTADALRRSLVRQLQSTLPRTVPTSVRADASRMPNDVFAVTEAKVKAAVFEAAHQSPELRTVIEKDRVGREQFTFYGQKRSWMDAYKAIPLLTKAINGQPVKIPVIL